MSKTMGFAIFVVGAGIGSATTWFFVKKKYEQIAQEEIDSVKEVFSRREPGKVKPDTEFDEEPDQADVTEYVAKIQEQGYTNYSGISKENKNTAKEEKKEEPENMDSPYVISPDEFGDYEDYERISLTYYADQILADDDDELVDDIDDVVGFDSLTHFGDYEDDSVFVRNDRLKCDYEILMDRRAYSDAMKKKPYKMED